MSDIFNKIDARERAGASKLTRLVKRYQIVYSGRCSKRVYTFRAGRKLVARAFRMGLDCYLSPLQIRV